jgi:hypothetical protein
VKSQGVISMANTIVDQMLKNLGLRVARLEAIAVFLIAHPGIASRCTLHQKGENVGLRFEDRAYIRPVGTHPVALRLEKTKDWTETVYDEGWQICF